MIYVDWGAVAPPDIDQGNVTSSPTGVDDLGNVAETHSAGVDYNADNVTASEDFGQITDPATSFRDYNLGEASSVSDWLIIDYPRYAFLRAAVPHGSRRIRLASVVVPPVVVQRPIICIMRRGRIHAGPKSKGPISGRFL